MTVPIKPSEGMPAGKNRVMLGRCADDSCGWQWVVVYLPMELLLSAELMKAARCPACGSEKVLVA